MRTAHTFIFSKNLFTIKPEPNQSHKLQADTHTTEYEGEGIAQMSTLLNDCYLGGEVKSTPNFAYMFCTRPKSVHIIWRPELS